jgi:hypothetical protein
MELSTDGNHLGVAHHLGCGLLVTVPRVGEQISIRDGVTVCDSLRAVLAEIDAGRMDASVVLRARMEGAVVALDVLCWVPMSRQCWIGWRGRLTHTVDSKRRDRDSSICQQRRWRTNACSASSCTSTSRWRTLPDSRPPLWERGQALPTRTVT